MRYCQLRYATIALFAVALSGCFVPPPKIPAIPASGLAVRLYVFGASATDAQRTFAAVKENNPSFSLVSAGGNGEVVVGLENDSPHCVPPTALCSYRVSYRIRDNDGVVVSAKTKSVEATATSCSDLCAKALTNVAVQIVETVAADLAEREKAEPSPAALVALAAPFTARAKAAPDAKTATRAEPAICSAARGQRLPSKDAETRAAQVEVLKRLNVLDQSEYDCLRKAYLERL